MTETDLERAAQVVEEDMDFWTDEAHPQDVLKRCAARIRALPNSQGWVSVSERLPERGVQVLIGWGNSPKVAVAKFIGGKRKRWVDPYESSDGLEFNTPTRWMLPPSPPGEQQKAAAQVSVGESTAVRSPTMQTSTLPVEPASAAPIAPQMEGWVSTALTDVAAERARQVSQEGWTPEHDSEHTAGDLGLAGACYAMHTAMIFEGNQQSAVPSPWPFEASWWKPKDPRRNLVKAAALIIAEIERIDRASPPSPASPQTEGEQSTAAQVIPTGDASALSVTPIQPASAVPHREVAPPADTLPEEPTHPDLGPFLSFAHGWQVEKCTHGPHYLNGRCIHCVVAAGEYVYATAARLQGELAETRKLAEDRLRRAVQYAKQLQVIRDAAERAGVGEDADNATEYMKAYVAHAESAELRLAEREKELEGVREALQPFANYACDPPCGCHNCKARAALSAASQGAEHEPR